MRDTPSQRQFIRASSMHGGEWRPAWYKLEMRYHKAAKISKPEADYIIGSGSASLTDTVVLQHQDNWYDVRRMTAAEIDAFVSDLARAEHAAEKADEFPPH
jgi:hypothetical protein